MASPISSSAFHMVLNRSAISSLRQRRVFTNAHAAFDFTDLARGIAQVVDRIFHAGFLPTQRYPRRAHRAMRRRVVRNGRSTRKRTAGTVRALSIVGERGARRLGTFPTPVEQAKIAGVRGALWIKRDDLNARRLAETDARCAGGNKLRALEFLLGRVRAATPCSRWAATGRRTLGDGRARAQLGAHTMAIRWQHDMNDVARHVDVGRASWPIRCGASAGQSARWRAAGSRRAVDAGRASCGGSRPVARRRSGCSAP